MQQRTPSRSNFIRTLAASARQTIAEGYYRNLRMEEKQVLIHRSLRDAIAHPVQDFAVITEVKFRSPAEGALRTNEEMAASAIARKYEKGGAAGISVLTEPKHFDGRIEYLVAVKRAVSIPVLMKDIVVDPAQVEAAKKVGADAVLLIASIFGADLASLTLKEMVDFAHSNGLEVLLEAHTPEEYATALKSDADVVGLNNRNLETLEVSIETSRSLLRSGGRGSKVVISESGLTKREELEELHALGADGFLVGSKLMKSKDIEQAVRELVGRRGDR